MFQPCIDSTMRGDLWYVRVGLPLKQGAIDSH